MLNWRLLITLSLLLVAALETTLSAEGPAVAQRPAQQSPVASPNSATMSVEELAAEARQSVVVVTIRGRDGRRQGLGSGFVVSPDGLIATNLHVIGEARPISVLMANGKQYDVISVHATERTTDLAILRIDAQKLPALELGDSDAIQDGQPVVAMGNPRGFQHSVVSGVVSGRREIDGIPMIQLAIPIEQGNSGGPILDRQGRVQGMVTLKSLVSENLGFAVAINALKPLLEKPNPVPISRWLTIGALNPKEWTPLFGARWRQRAGQILVEGSGQGFGGRSLCLSTQDPPELPFEVSVKVRLEDESGAAGLVFHADGNNVHYGFYPSNGQLRLSRFDGPDVYSWQVLSQKRSAHYQPGDWNTLKVRLQQDGFQCFLNGRLVIESTDARLSHGKIGLAKFRDTQASFKGFQVAKQIPSDRPSAETVAELTRIVADIPPDRPPTADLIDRLLAKDHLSSSGSVLHDRARLLEQQAKRVRQLARAVRAKRIQAQLAVALEGEEAKIDLLHAALLVAKLDNDELNVAAYLKTVRSMAEEVSQNFTDKMSDREKLAALDEFLFQQQGFHGSRTDYYNSSNSYLNEVLDDREGLPISLSVLYMELARRLGVAVVGVGLPGHFVVRYEPGDGDAELVDVFDRGKRLTQEQAAAKVRAITGGPLLKSHLRAYSKKEIVVRMLRNLVSIAQGESDVERMLTYIDTIVAIAEESGQERWYRAMLRYQTGRVEEALADVEWLLDHPPPGVDFTRIREFQNVLENARQSRDM